MSSTENHLLIWYQECLDYNTDSHQDEQTKKQQKYMKNNVMPQNVLIYVNNIYHSVYRKYKRLRNYKSMWLIIYAFDDYRLIFTITIGQRS